MRSGSCPFASCSPCPLCQSTIVCFFLNPRLQTPYPAISLPANPLPLHQFLTNLPIYQISMIHFYKARSLLLVKQTLTQPLPSLPAPHCRIICFSPFCSLFAYPAQSLPLSALNRFYRSPFCTSRDAPFLSSPGSAPTPFSSCPFPFVIFLFSPFLFLPALSLYNRPFLLTNSTPSSPHFPPYLFSVKPLPLFHAPPAPSFARTFPSLLLHLHRLHSLFIPLPHASF